MKSIKELLTNKPITEGGCLYTTDDDITIRYKGKKVNWKDLEVDWTDGYKDKTGSFQEFIDDLVNQCQRIFG